MESASAQTFTYYADEMVWLMYQRHQVQGNSAELSNIILATCTSLSSWCHCQDAKKQTEVFQGTSSFNWGEFKLNTVARLNLRQGFSQITAKMMGVGGWGYKEIIHRQQCIVTHIRGGGRLAKTDSPGKEFLSNNGKAGTPQLWGDKSTSIDECHEFLTFKN